MKDGVVIAVVLLIVAGGLFVWYTQTPAHYGAPVADTQVQQPEPAPKPAPVVLKARPKPKEEPAVEQAAPAPEPVVVAVAAPVVHRDPLPFPAVEQIPTGVHGDSITRQVWRSAALGRDFDWWSRGGDHGLRTGTRTVGYGDPGRRREGFVGVLANPNRWCRRACRLRGAVNRSIRYSAILMAITVNLRECERRRLHS